MIECKALLLVHEHPLRRAMREVFQNQLPPILQLRNDATVFAQLPSLLPRLPAVGALQYIALTRASLSHEVGYKHVNFSGFWDKTAKNGLKLRSVKKASPVDIPCRV